MNLIISYHIIGLNSSTPIKNMSMDSLKLNKVLNHVSLDL
jgi:hypothetical protein